MTLVPPRPSFPLPSSFPLPPPPSAPSLSRYLSLFLAHLPYLGWLHHNGHQAPRPGTTPSLPNPDRTKKYIVRQPPKRGSYRALSCFRRRGRNVTFLMCRNAHLMPRRVAPRQTSKFSIIIDITDNITTRMCWRGDWGSFVMSDNIRRLSRTRY